MRTKLEGKGHMLDDISSVVSQGSCSGCGACAVISQGSLKMASQSNGTYLPVQIKETVPSISHAVCPFTVKNKNHRIGIGAEKSAGLGMSYPLIGEYVSLGVGRISNDEVWESSSGGLTTWLLGTLLKRELIDGVVHLGRSKDSSPEELFTYVISTDQEQLKQAKGTKYYAATFENSLTQLSQMDGSFAFVGVPCFVNAIDLLRMENPLWKSKIKYTVGLVCGHLKTQKYAEILAAQLGIFPSHLTNVNFRKKKPEGNPIDYEFSAQNTNGEWFSSRSSELLGANWGHSAYSLSACNSCTDVFAYTSDVTFGDAWLPEYSFEPKGTNVFVSRNPEISDLLSAGLELGEIELESILPDRMLSSQRGGIDHRVVGYLIRNSKTKSSEQLDFSLNIPKPRMHRVAIIRFRAFIQAWTFKQTSIEERRSFGLWKIKFTLSKRAYDVLDLIQKVSRRITK